MSLGPSFGSFKVLMDGNNGYLVGFDSVLLRSQCLARRMSCRCGSMSFTSHLSQSTFWQACATTLGCSKTALRILFKEAGIDWLRSPGRQVFDKLIHNLFLIGVCSQAPCLSIMRLVTSARAATSQSTRVAGNMMRMVGWSDGRMVRDNHIMVRKKRVIAMIKRQCGNIAEYGRIVTCDLRSGIKLGCGACSLQSIPVFQARRS